MNMQSKKRLLIVTNRYPAGPDDIASPFVHDFRKALEAALDYGWRLDWQYFLDNPNLDTIADDEEFKRLFAMVEADMRKQREAVLALPHAGEYDLRDKQNN